MDPNTPNEPTNPTPESTAPFGQEMPGTTPATPAVIPGETVQTNPAPAAPFAAPVAAPVAPQPAPQPVPQPAAATPSPTKALAITSMVLGIVAFLIGFVWYVAALLAIAAVILGIIALVKHQGGKGMSLTGLIIGGITLLVVVPFWFIAGLGYASFQERAQELQTQTEQREESTLELESL